MKGTKNVFKKLNGRNNNAFKGIWEMYNHAMDFAQKFTYLFCFSVLSNFKNINIQQ